MALRDILVRFGIEVGGKEKLDDVDKKLKKAKDSASDLEKMLKRIGAAFVGKAIADFVLDTIAMADALKHNAERLGLTTDELQRYQYVADIMGVSAQQAAVGLRFFNRAIGEAAFGTQSAVKVFQQLGVSVKDANGKIKPTDELLFEVADKIKATGSAAERTAIAMRLLGRGGSSMLPMLQEGSVELRKYFKDVDDLGGGFNETFVKAAHETDYAIRRLKLAWRSIRVAIVTEILPALRGVIDRVMAVAKVLIDAAKHTLGFATAWRFLLGVLGAGAIVWAAVNAEMLPAYLLFGALALAVLFLYLVFDDFYTFMKGQPSVLGDTLGPNGGAKFRADVEAVVAVFSKLIDSIFGAGAGSKSLAERFEDLAGAAIPATLKGFIAIVQVLDELITDAMLAYKTLKLVATWSFSTDSYDKTNADLAAQWEDIKATNAGRVDRFNALGDAWNGLNSGPPAAGSRVPGMGPGYSPSADEMDPGAALNGRSRTPSSDPLAPANINVKIENTFHVAGSADPATVGAAAANGTKQGMKDAASQNRDTYDAVTAGLLPLSGA